MGVGDATSSGGLLVLGHDEARKGLSEKLELSGDAAFTAFMVYDLVGHSACVERATPRSFHASSSPDMLYAQI